MRRRGAPHGVRFDTFGTVRDERTAAGRRVLVAFFSRAGENYYYGGRRNLAVGNTEVVAGMIRDCAGADLYKIEPADRYPDSYDETVDRNNEEQESKERPAMAGALPDVGPYEVVILGSPVWGGRAPGSCRRSSTGSTWAARRCCHWSPMRSAACPGYRSALTTATVQRGLAVRGEEVRDAGADVDNWLRGHNLIS